MDRMRCHDKNHIIYRPKKCSSVHARSLNWKFHFFSCCCCCCLHQHDRIMCARVNTKRKTLMCSSKSSSRKKPHRALSTISQTSAAKIKTKRQWAQTRSDLLSTNWLGILLNIFLLLPVLISIFLYLAKWNFMSIIIQSSSENLNFFVRCISFFFLVWTRVTEWAQLRFDRHSKSQSQKKGKKVITF